MLALGISNLVLWVLVVALSVVVLALARQVGVLHERIKPVGALMLAKGPQVGASAPQVVVTDMGGNRRQIGAARADGRSTLLVFVSPTCPICKAILPVLKTSRLSERDWAEIVLASDGGVSEQSEYIKANDLQSFTYVLSADLGMAYQVGRLPFAAIIDETGVLRARGIINSREHLESLIEAKRQGVASLQEYLEQKSKSHAA